MNMPAPERSALAVKVNVHEQYLYQCLTGRKAMTPAEAVRVEQESDRSVMRWHLRQGDWYRIWPELIGAPGAPEVPEVDSAPSLPAGQGV